MSETTKRERKEIIIAENRSFEGVWIPKRLYITNKFNLRTKFFVVEIKSLSKSGYCFATDKHFAEFLGVSDRMVQTMIKQLKDDGYLTAEYEYEKDTKAIKRRFLILTQKFLDEFYNEEETRPTEKKFNTPPEENFNEPTEINFDTGTEKNCGEKYNNKTIYNSGLSNADSSITSNSFSTEKDLQSNSPKGEHSNSFSGEKKTATSNQTKRHSEKEMENMVNQIPLRARRIAYEMTNDTDKAARVYECIDYFLGKHKEYSKERHKVLKDETLRKIIFKFIEGIEIERDGYIDVYDGLASTSEFVGDYRDVIDEYFNTDFKEKCDYSLVHFSSDTVLTNMMNHVCKEEWCESM